VQVGEQVGPMGFLLALRFSRAARIGVRVAIAVNVNIALSH
jgi:hypothetical protein